MYMHHMAGLLLQGRCGYCSMMTSSNGTIFRVTGLLCGEFTGPGEIPAQRQVTRILDGFFDLRLNKRLSKQPWGWWFETPPWSLWRHCNGLLTHGSETHSSRSPNEDVWKLGIFLQLLFDAKACKLIKAPVIFHGLNTASRQTNLGTILCYRKVIDVNGLSQLVGLRAISLTISYKKCSCSVYVNSNCDSFIAKTFGICAIVIICNYLTIWI